jgi:hypothetical protein
MIHQFVLQEQPLPPTFQFWLLIDHITNDFVLIITTAWDWYFWTTPFTWVSRDALRLPRWLPWHLAKEQKLPSSDW